MTQSVSSLYSLAQTAVLVQEGHLQAFVIVVCTILIKNNQVLCFNITAR